MLPLLTGSLAGVGMGFTDTVIVGHVGATDLAGVSVAVSIIMTITVAFSGFLGAVSPLFAEDCGAGRPDRAQRRFMNTLYTMAGVIAATELLLVLGYFSFDWMPLEDDVRQVARNYMLYALPGVPIFILTMALRVYDDGIGKTQISMYISFAALFLNLLLDLLFVYGAGPIPAMGGPGAAVASTLTEWLLLPIAWSLTAIMLKKSQFKPRICFIKPDKDMIKLIVRQGLPLSIATGFESSAFLAFCVLSSWFGTLELAANQILFNLMTLLFMVPLALSITVSIRIGYAIGKSDSSMAQTAVSTCYWIALPIAFVLAVASYVLSDEVALLYTNDLNVVAIISASFLPVALYQIGDYCQCIANGALRGLKDTAIITVVSIAAYWGFGVPFAWYLAFKGLPGMEPAGFIGLWISLCITLYLIALVYCPRVIRDLKKLRKMFPQSKNE